MSSGVLGCPHGRQERAVRLTAAKDRSGLSSFANKEKAPQPRSLTGLALLHAAEPAPPPSGFRQKSLQPLAALSCPPVAGFCGEGVGLQSHLPKSGGTLPHLPRPDTCFESRQVKGELKSTLGLRGHQGLGVCRPPFLSPGGQSHWRTWVLLEEMSCTVPDMERARAGRDSWGHRDGRMLPPPCLHAFCKLRSGTEPMPTQ